MCVCGCVCRATTAAYGPTQPCIEMVNYALGPLFTLLFGAFVTELIVCHPGAASIDRKITGRTASGGVGTGDGDRASNSITSATGLMVSSCVIAQWPPWRTMPARMFYHVRSFVRVCVCAWPESERCSCLGNGIMCARTMRTQCSLANN